LGPPSQQARVGIVGFGFGGRYFHAPFIASVDGLELAAIVTGSADRASQARALYPNAAIVGTVDELLDRTDVDIVVVTTPNRVHHEIAMQSIARGRHVVIDKPMAMSVKQAESIIRAAEQQGVVLSVFQNRRWDGDFLTLRSLVDTGAVGPIDSLESRFEVFARGGRVGWRERTMEGGGPLRDLGTHLIDQAILLFGPPGRLWAQVGRHRPATEVEDSVFVAIDHDSGVRSRLWASWIASRPGPRFRLRGGNGEYVKEHMDIQEEQLMAGIAPSSSRYGKEPRARWGRLHSADGTITAVPTARGDYTTYYRMFLDAVHGTGPVPVDPRNSLGVLAVVRAVEQAAASGRVQTF
jgi:predicted dehydrogenase